MEDVGEILVDLGLRDEVRHHDVGRAAALAVGAEIEEPHPAAVRSASSRRPNTSRFTDFIGLLPALAHLDRQHQVEDVRPRI